MITTEGNTITWSDPHRHKFADALTEYIYDDMDSWSSDAGGDHESQIGWFAQIGKRILRGDGQGFVWLERFGNEHEADMIIRALRHYDDIWSMGEWSEDEDFEPFSTEHDDMLTEALNYVAYVYACDAESCDPPDIDMWRVHDRPSGPLG